MATPPPPQVRPSRLWYWVGGAVAVLAIAGAILIFTSGDEDLGDLVDVLATLEEVEGPGEVTVDLHAGDEWAIYMRGGPIEGRPCSVRGPNGETVDLDSQLGFSNVTYEGREYVEQFTFDAADSGAYEIRCGLVPGGTAIVGESLDAGEVFGFFGRAALAIAALLIGAMATCAIVLPVALTRSKRIRELRSAS